MFAEKTINIHQIVITAMKKNKQSIIKSLGWGVGWGGGTGLYFAILLCVFLNRVTKGSSNQTPEGSLMNMWGEGKCQCLKQEYTWA